MQQRLIIGSSLAIPEVPASSVHLVATSPPYWQLKDYGKEAQVGYDQSWPDYVRSLTAVWAECRRVLVPGGRLCVNVGDQFARAAVYGRFEVLPIRTEIMAACMRLGFQHMPDIIWRKATTVNTSGGAVVMGSFPYPRNGIPKIDYEFILIFKKPGRTAPPSAEAKEASRLDPATWNEYFLGHWTFPGERKGAHLAAFPLELPHRLIRMFTFAGETVLDPFAGSGTTLAAAAALDRNGIGVEINPTFEPLIRERLAAGETATALEVERQVSPVLTPPTEIQARNGTDERTPLPPAVLPVGLRADGAAKKRFFGSRVRDGDRAKNRWGKPRRVKAVEQGCIVVLEPGGDANDGGAAERIRLRGIATIAPRDRDAERATEALRRLIGRSRVVVSEVERATDGTTTAYLHLLNRTFLNGRLIRDGFATADHNDAHRHRTRFINYERTARESHRGLWAEHPHEQTS